MKLGSSRYWFGLNKAVIYWIVTLGRHDTHIFLYNRNGILVDYIGYTPNTSFITVFKRKWEFQRERSRDVAFLWASWDCQNLQDSVTCLPFPVWLSNWTHQQYTDSEVRIEHGMNAGKSAVRTCLRVYECDWKRETDEELLPDYGWLSRMRNSSIPCWESGPFWAGAEGRGSSLCLLTASWMQGAPWVFARCCPRTEIR